mmetsp:Transcript_4636/g.17434  ORF Transcript_4636/g.17434 Transcript_4636/m.17434 type:complete len:210 (+) Transcript_4636:2218-2847(+)
MVVHHEGRPIAKAFRPLLDIPGVAVPQKVLLWIHPVDMGHRRRSIGAVRPVGTSWSQFVRLPPKIIHAVRDLRGVKQSNLDSSAVLSSGPSISGLHPTTSGLKSRCTTIGLPIHLFEDQLLVRREHTGRICFKLLHDEAVVHSLIHSVALKRSIKELVIIAVKKFNQPCNQRDGGSSIDETRVHVLSRAEPCCPQLFPRKEMICHHLLV